MGRGSTGPERETHWELRGREEERGKGEGGEEERKRGGGL